MKYSKWLPVIFSLAYVVFFAKINGAMAQEDIFRNGIDFGVGTRAIGLGGAYNSIGDDYSASYWNPAALAMIRRFEFSSGMSHTLRQNDASFGDATTSDQMSLTRFDALGIVYPVPTYRGSLVFSFGYNKVKSFDSNFAFETFNPLPDDSVRQSFFERENGTLNNWTIAGAMDLSAKFSVGMGFNIWTGRDNYQYSEKEADMLDIYTFDHYRLDDTIDSKISGVNLTLGGIYRLSKHMRLAGTVATPTTLTIKEAWTTSDETVFDDSGIDNTGDDGAFEYKLRSPFKFTAGASINFAGLLLTGQWEFIDWSQLRYESEPPIENLTRAKANEFLAEKYRPVERLRLGAELTFPGTATQVRAGYFRDPSPLRQSNIMEDREFYSVGLGFLLDKQVKIDVAYVIGTWVEQNPGLNNYVTALREEITLQKLYATLSIRL